jgi:uncharacterized membrane protein YccC
MTHGGDGAPALRQAPWPRAGRLADIARSAGPALLFGFRVWAAASLALYVAFWLELDTAYWAGTTAAAATLPSLGGSQRRATFRMVGTLVGAVAIVVLTACFPQNRGAFLIGLALWMAGCGFVGRLMQNLMSFAAAWAGITAAIIALKELGEIGGANGDAFTLAVTRATEIWIGIACATVVLAGTALGRTRGQLSNQIAAIASEITGRLIGMFSLSGHEAGETRTVRRDLTQRAIALGPVVDDVLGESSDLRFRSQVLKDAVDGLYAALAGWRTAAYSLEFGSPDQARRDAARVLASLPLELRSAAAPSVWIAGASRLRRACRAAVRALVALRGGTPSLQLLCDSTAEALIGISRALDGLLLLQRPSRSGPRSRAGPWHVPDILPALVDSTRVFLAIIVAEAFWIWTAWPGGVSAVTFAGLVTLALPSSRGDQLHARALAFLLGGIVSAVCAAVIKFAVLPGVDTYFGFCLAIGLVLVPAAALELWKPPLFFAMVAFFIPLLGPANPIDYDQAAFYNQTLGILAGICVGSVAFLLVPAPSRELLARRLLALTLRDLRRLASGRIPSTAADWQSRIYNRLSALPDGTDPLQNARLITALTVGTEIIRLCRLLPRLDRALSLAGVLSAVAAGESALAIESLAEVERAIAASTATGASAAVGLRARASIRAISDALTQHADYFDGRAFA